ncbi:HAD-IA family hydrolase [Candidatus Enterococcus ferrettii]|uniref:Phosphoglycolate phosphatase n=1 Tax=Candidatus Enterococcus ferrettii TaxID=2815324 RepID=A0ABV0EQF7_9ENTE|nr:HAD-IA family hydrolase [Enterococcus sp. 665A]MBO1340952.1 HAD-IA family hydrolase [Enterococcus sp. 665A]
MKNFIWDFDGTLYDTYPVMMDALMQALQDFKVEAERHQVYEMIKAESIRYLIEQQNLPEDSFNRVFHQYENQILKDSFPFSDAKQTLENLKLRGGRHFIVTHRTVEATWKLLKRDFLDNLIEDIIGSDSGYPRKPDPTSLNALIKNYGLDRKETIMIGDRKLDIEAGENAQIATCFYNRDHLDTQVNATYTITHLKEISSLFHQ